jgi:serine/threonine protein kinase
MEVDNLNPLPVGTRLQEFVIERLIGIGGFGIVYQANDTLLHRTVAIKEYMPTSLASRNDGATVSIRSSSHSQDFETGKISFINEARMLARFKHAALIEVFRFWEQNGTAYMATPFYEGNTLKDQLREMGNLPDEATLKKVLLPVLDALEHMHEEQIYHRDISPDNIMILKDGRPVLLDLGAARRLEVANAQALTVLVKPGYAPIEQYAGDGAVQQGPWTDIYGWGATAYFALTRKPPPPSASRIMSDSIVRLSESKPTGFSSAFLAAIDAALAVRPDDRPQSVSDLKRILNTDFGDAQTGLLVADDAVTKVIESAPEVRLDALPSVAAPKAQFVEPSVPTPPKKALPKVAIIAALATITVVIATSIALTKKSPPAIVVQTPILKTAPVVVSPEVVAPVAIVPSVVEAPAVLPPQEVAPAVPSSPPIEAKPVEKLVDKPATARFAIKPWGEVFVNGESRGVSPPVKSLSLSAGEYKIEIRNGDFPTYKVTAKLKAGESFKINHAFVEAAQK